MENLIATLFLARELAHREHLRTRSYAAHIALSDFYEGIIDRADAIAEAYQGGFELLGEIPILVNAVNGTIIEVRSKEVLVDIGYKSEGVIPSNELSIRKNVDPHDEVELGEEVALRARAHDEIDVEGKGRACAGRPHAKAFVGLLDGIYGSRRPDLDAEFLERRHQPAD